MALSPSLVTTQIIQRSIARVTLNNPKRRNALSYQMLTDLSASLQAIKQSSDVRVVILAASGSAFSSGHDLTELVRNRNKNSGEDNSNLSLMKLCSSVMQTIVQLQQPVIAQVEGIATAAGCQLVASCDLAYASEKARFSTPGVNIGLFCSTPAVALGRSVHRKHAMEMLLTGDMISAQDAERIGLINAVIEEDGDNTSLEHVVLEIASKIASKSSRAIELGKPLFYRQLELPMHAAYEITSEAMSEHMMNEEAREGMNAFLTKQSPNWSPRD